MRKTKLSILEMVFFEKWKHSCWPKHTTERTKKTKSRKGIWMAKQNRKPQKTEIIDEKKPFKCNSWCSVSWNKRKETRQERTTKKQGMKQSTRKEGRNKKNKKQDRERQRVKKEKWKKPRRKKGRHWEMNKITRFQRKNSVFVKDTKPKILRRVEGQQPKTTRAGFFLVPLVSSWSRIVFVYLVHYKSVTHLVFYFRCFVFLHLGGCVSFLFPFLSLLCSLLLILFFFFSAFSLCVTKKPDQITEYLNSSFDVLLWCLHPRILTWPS